MIILDNLAKTYWRGQEEVHALSGVSVEVKDGEYLAVLGPSGSGKSTLMNLIGLLDRPTQGKVVIDGQSVDELSEKQLEGLRGDTIGFVFQQFLLIPTMTALQNVMLPLYFAGKRRAKECAVSLLTRVGLAERVHHLPSQLSGGEIQRVAVARALANNPKVLLADEPTGNLDSKTAEEVCALFKEINGTGTTIIVVTHNTELAALLPRTLTLRDGRLVSDEQKDHLGA